MYHSQKNLIPYNSETARINGSKKKTITPAKRFSNQKYCNNHCPFCECCPAITTSRSQQPIVVGKAKRKLYPCFIKTLPKEVQNRFQKLFIDGESGIVSCILEEGYKLSLKTMGKDTSAKELRENIRTLIEMKKAIYGDKQNVKLEGQIGVFQAPELRNILKELDERDRNRNRESGENRDSKEA